MATRRNPPLGTVRDAPGAHLRESPSEHELLTPEHVRAILELARALSGAAERAELATIAADQRRSWPSCVGSTRSRC
jgi:hypothetical protein